MNDYVKCLRKVTRTIEDAEYAITQSESAKEYLIENYGEVDNVVHLVLKDLIAYYNYDCE